MNSAPTPDPTPEMEASPSVAVVIPTHNNMALLRSCLSAVLRISYPPDKPDKFEVIVVDNGSSDGTAEAVARLYPNVRTLRFEQNTGFAHACNRGAAAASSSYVAFLNDDAIPDRDWLANLFKGLRAGGEGAVCAASRILSRDGGEIEYNGASSNLFGVGRPRSVWGWPDAPQPPTEGSPLLFASGGAMLIHRRTFLDAGGFDPNFFAYFEDVDLGWRLWTLGYKVVYAPAATVRHVGGATGSRQGAHRRYTLWEANSLAIVLKNYEGGNMERILAAGLMLLYKRALLAAGDAFDPASYWLTAPRDNNPANVERLPKVSVAHLAAIDRFNRLLPRLMEERRSIQARRVRSDREILPLLGRLWEAQFAGEEYAEAARALAAALDLYGVTEQAAPNRVLVMAASSDEEAPMLASRLAPTFHVALVQLSEATKAVEEGSRQESGYTLHTMRPDSPALHGLAQQADAIVVFPGAVRAGLPANMAAPVALVGELPADGRGLHGAARFPSIDDDGLILFCRKPGALPTVLRP